MRIAFNIRVCQFLLLLLLAALCACNSKKEETPVIPPLTSPLSRDYIGFGVITASFTHITSDPSEDSSYIGYLRRGSLVRIVRRQIVKTSDGYVNWVLTGGDQHGWLKEDVMDIYENESQARTASESMIK